MELVYHFISVRFQNALHKLQYMVHNSFAAASFITAGLFVNLCQMPCFSLYEPRNMLK